MQHYVLLNIIDDMVHHKVIPIFPFPPLKPSCCALCLVQDLDLLTTQPLHQLLRRLRGAAPRSLTLLEHVAQARVPRLLLKHRSGVVLDVVEAKRGLEDGMGWWAVSNPKNEKSGWERFSGGFDDDPLVFLARNWWINAWLSPRNIIGIGMSGNCTYRQRNNCNRENDAKPWVGGIYHTFRRTGVHGGLGMPNLFWE